MKQSWRKKWAPSGRRMMILLITILVVDLGLLAYLTRKPICIESSLIYELEWVFKNGNKVRAYNCDAKINVPLSKVFIEKLPELQRRISQLEGLLKTNFIPIQPVRLSLHEGNSQNLQVSADSVNMSDQSFFSGDLLLERSYLKSWVQQFQKGQGLGILRLEVMTHFLMWNLGVQDQIHRHWQTLLGQWPQLATSWSGYCKSPVRDEAYEMLCLSPSLQKRAESLTPFSLNYWLAEKLWQSFQVLEVREQIEFFKKMGTFIQALSASDEVLLSEMTLEELDGFARTEADVWKSALDQVGFQDWGWNFTSKIASELDAYNHSLGRVDVLLHRKAPWTAQELHDLQSLALVETNYRIMAENDEGLWSFPWIAPIEPEAFPALKAQNMIWISCEWPTVEELLAQQEKASKVIVVQECNENPEILILAGLLHRGLQFFSLDNKDTKFVVVNLEALKFMLNKEISLSKRQLVSNLQTKESKNYLSTLASWKSALWNQKYRAYEVQATVDIIEWFKLPENVWPDFAVIPTSPSQ
jgi:hypothetical protein